MTNKIEVCKTCNGTGIEYDGAGHTCTACSGIAAPVANRTAKEVLEGRTQQDWEIIGLKATVAQQAQRNAELVELLNGYPRGVPGFAAWADKVTAALKPTESGAGE